MKIAQLPDGTNLQFPADMADSDVDAAVRRHLGLPDLLDQGAEQQAFLQAVDALLVMAQTFQQAVTALTAMVQQQAQVASVIAAIPDALMALPTVLAQSSADQQEAHSAALQELSSQVGAIAKTVIETNMQVAAANQEVAAVLRAPNMLMFDGSKPIGMRRDIGSVKRG